MHPILRSFKRQYHKVRDAAKLLDGRSTFALTIRSDASGLQAKCSTPDEDTVIRFEVLMRRLLDPLDPIFYQRVWLILKEEFPDELSEQALHAYGLAVSSLQTCSFTLTINGEVLSPETIYRTLAKAEYFGHDEEARGYLLTLVGAPIAGALLWHHFYAYTLAGLEVASVIFGAIREVEASEKYHALYPDEVPEQEQRCIYCLRTCLDATFTSEEHTVPESLGNDELVLPRGYVCDTCNNEVLSQLDRALLEFGPISFLRVLYVSHTKAGKLPRATFLNAQVERTRPGEVRIILKDEPGRVTSEQELGNGWISFDFRLEGEAFHPCSLARSLYKIGLGLVALSQGHAEACKSKYDEARRFILKGGGYPNNLLIRTTARPEPQVRASYLSLAPGTPVFLSVYGLMFILNLEVAPSVELSQELADHHFESWPTNQ